MTPQQDKSQDPVNILIAEDSPTQAEQLKYILEEHGYTVTVAANGKLALTAIEKHPPTLVISDVVMPEMDGFQLCRQIKADETLKNIPVVLLTALSDPHDVIRGLQCGADNFITKPYEEKYLITRIQFILANRALLRQEKTEMGIKIFFEGQHYFITSERQQILNLLLSTYETAVEKNQELIRIQNELKALNEQLEEKVKERTAVLTAEIAERKRAEKHILKLNRVYAILSGVNQAIVRIRELQALFEEVCRIAVEPGGFRMAWIGLVDDTTRQIRSVASAGESGGYLEGIHI